MFKEGDFSEFIHYFEVGDFLQLIIGVVEEFLYWGLESVVFAEGRVIVFDFLFFLLHDNFASWGYWQGLVGLPCVHFWFALYFNVYSLVLDAEVQVPLFDFELLVVSWLAESGDISQESLLNFLNSFILIVFVILELTVDLEILVLLWLHSTKIEIRLGWILSEYLLCLLSHTEIEHSTSRGCLLLRLLPEQTSSSAS